MKIVIGISGASGAIYGIELLKKLIDISKVEIHLIISKAARITIAQETNYKIKDLEEMANFSHSYNNIAASIASGSYLVDAMIIAPCSTKTLAEIANGITPNLLSRTADVILKERKKLILLLRESPLHMSHLNNMIKVTEMGGIIAPPVPAFYNKPNSIEEMVNYTVIRTLDLLNIHIKSNSRWKEEL